MRQLLLFLAALFLSTPTLADKQFGRWSVGEDKNSNTVVFGSEGVTNDGRSVIFSFTKPATSCTDMKFALTVPITKEKSASLRDGSSTKAYDGQVRVDELSLQNFKYLISHKGDPVLFVPFAEIEELLLLDDMQKGKMMRLKVGPINVNISLEGFNSAWKEGGRCSPDQPTDQDSKFFNVPPAKLPPSAKDLAR